MLYNGKAQPGAFCASVPLRIHLPKILKDFAEVFFTYAAAGILYMKNKQLFLSILSGFSCDICTYISFFCKFDGVIEYVDQNLFDPAVIAVVTAWNRFVTFVF